MCWIENKKKMKINLPKNKNQFAKDALRSTFTCWSDDYFSLSVDVKPFAKPLNYDE